MGRRRGYAITLTVTLPPTVVVAANQHKKAKYPGDERVVTLPKKISSI